jgi:hypothetical protein
VYSVVERQSDRLRLYNLASVGEEREWLRDVLLTSGSESSSDDDTPAGKELRLQRILKERRYQNKYARKYYKDPSVSITTKNIMAVDKLNLFTAAATVFYRG